MHLPYLDPTSHKAVCCNCGKKTFVNYLDANGQPIGDGVFGRCDRQDHCRYYRYPYEYLQQLKTMTIKKKRQRRIPLAISGTTDAPATISTHATTHATTHAVVHAANPAPARIYPLPLRSAPVVAPPQTIDRYSMERTVGNYASNPLAQFLHRIFDPLINASTVDSILKRYCVGTNYDNAVIYWQIDARGLIRTGKTISYDATTGKRSHAPGATGWMHRQPYRLEQAFFGSHLIKETRPLLEKHNELCRTLSLPPLAPTIWLFESEKGALIAAMYLAWAGFKSHHIIPMATGSCDCFNPTKEALANPYHRLQVLRGNRLVLFPDEGMFDSWLEKARRLPTGFCQSLAISPILDEKRLLEAVGSKGKLECEVHPGDGPDDIFLRYIELGRIDDISDLPLY